MAVCEFRPCHKSKCHLTGIRIDGDDFPPQEVGSWRHFLEVIGHPPAIPQICGGSNAVTDRGDAAMQVALTDTANGPRNRRPAT